METRDKIAIAATFIAALALIPPLIAVSKGTPPPSLSIQQTGNGNTVNLNSPTSITNFFSIYGQTWQRGYRILLGRDAKDESSEAQPVTHPRTEPRPQSEYQDHTDPGASKHSRQDSAQAPEGIDHTTPMRQEPQSSATPDFSSLTSPTPHYSKWSNSGGTVLAGIEVGMSGIKAVVLRLSERAQFPEYSIQTTFKREVAINLRFQSDQTQSIEQLMSIVRLVTVLFAELQKLGPKLTIIAAPEVLGKFVDMKELARAVKVATGKDLRYIREDEQLHLTMLSISPPQRLTSLALIDVGSGNTKLSYMTPLSAGGLKVATIPYGTASLKQIGAKEGIGGIEGILAAEVTPAVRLSAQEVPGISKGVRQIVVIGGAAWAAATLLRNGNLDEDYVSFTLAELRTLTGKIKSNTYEPAPRNAEAAMEIVRVLDVFSRDDLIAALNLLDAILHEVEGGNRAVVFPRESGWLYGLAILTNHARK